MYSIERARQVRELELYLHSRGRGEIKDDREEYDKGEPIEAIEVDLRTGRVTFIDRAVFPKV